MGKSFSSSSTMISDAVIAIGPDFFCSHSAQESTARESGAEDATAFISQLEDFKQKRKGGLILRINCSREVPLPSRADSINSLP